MTQAKVGRTLGIPRSAVSQIEGGQRGVSGLELHRLAQLYSRDLGAFLEDRFETTNPVTGMFRAHPELRGSVEAMESIRRCGEFHRELMNLHELLELDRCLPTIPSYSLPAPKSKWDAVQQGDTSAERERRRLDLGIAPLPDVADLLGEQGISTALVEMDDGISGLTWMTNTSEIVVAANQTHHILRRRFSFAHEYAHVLLDRELKTILSHSGNRSSLTEVRANAFGASFLMPAQGVRSYVGALSKGLPSRTRVDTFDENAATRVEGRVVAQTQSLGIHDVVRMAHHYRVSLAAMLYRLKNLGFLTEAERSRLAEYKEADIGKLRSAFGLPRLDHAGERMRFRSRFVALAIEAFERGQITGRKLDELGKLVDVAHLRLMLSNAGFGERLDASRSKTSEH